MGVYKHQNGMGLGLNFKGWTLGLGETLHRSLKLKKKMLPRLNILSYKLFYPTSDYH